MLKKNGSENDEEHDSKTCSGKIFWKSIDIRFKSAESAELSVQKAGFDSEKFKFKTIHTKQLP